MNELNDEETTEQCVPQQILHKHILVPYNYIISVTLQYLGSK